MKLKSLIIISIFLSSKWINADPNLPFEFNSSVNRVIEKLETDGVINGDRRGDGATYRWARHRRVPPTGGLGGRGKIVILSRFACCPSR